MNDCVERVIATTENFFGVACTTTNLVREACTRHDVGPTAAVALGRALTGAALLAALLKDEQSVLLKFEADGPLKKIITEAGADGWVRGYVGEPHVDVTEKHRHIDVASALGKKGFLSVSKDIGGSVKYKGTIPLYSSEIGEDLAYYLTQSEQTPSTLALAVQLDSQHIISAAGGFLIQSLPPANNEIVSRIENQINCLPSLSSMLMAQKRPSNILSMIFQDVTHKNLGSKNLYYQCSCSLAKMKNALTSLGRKGILDLLNNEGETDVRCEFCRQCYHFNKEELQQLLFDL